MTLKFIFFLGHGSVQGLILYLTRSVKDLILYLTKYFQDLILHLARTLQDLFCTPKEIVP